MKTLRRDVHRVDEAPALPARRSRADGVFDLRRDVDERAPARASRTTAPCDRTSSIPPFERKVQLIFGAFTAGTRRSEWKFGLVPQRPF